MNSDGGEVAVVGGVLRHCCWQVNAAEEQQGSEKWQALEHKNLPGISSLPHIVFASRLVASGGGASSALELAAAGKQHEKFKSENLNAVKCLHITTILVVHSTTKFPQTFTQVVPSSSAG